MEFSVKYKVQVDTLFFKVFLKKSSGDFFLNITSSWKLQRDIPFFIFKEKALHTFKMRHHGSLYGDKRIRSSRKRFFVKKSVLKNFANFTGEHLCWRLQKRKKKRLQHKCFPPKFLRTPTLKDICERLILNDWVNQLRPMFLSYRTNAMDLHSADWFLYCGTLGGR